MYSRYPNYRFAGGVRLPENYSGNAFVQAGKDKADTAEKVSAEPSAVPLDAIETGRESAIESAVEQEARENGEATYESERTAEVMKPLQKRVRRPAFKFDIGRIFSGGFGFEELLIIALILVISQGESEDDVIVLLLALLLFIG